MADFKGVDVSKWQGDINFDLLAKAVSFVIYKGTGADNGLYVDPEFLRNHAQARSHKMHRGIYHFGGGGDAAQEARYFYQECLTNLLPGEVVVLDAEYGHATDPAWCLEFLQTLERLIDFKPMIYMNQSLMLSKDWSQVAKANYGLWLADWDGNPDIVVSMKYWSFCAIQQYADNGKIAGIAGAVDVDAFFASSISVFDKYGKPAPVAPAPAPAPAPVKTVTVSPPATPVPAPQPAAPAPAPAPAPVEPAPAPVPTPEPAPIPAVPAPVPSQPQAVQYNILERLINWLTSLIKRIRSKKG